MSEYMRKVLTDPEVIALKELYIKAIGESAPGFNLDTYSGLTGYKAYLRECIREKRRLKPPLLDKALRQVEDWTKNE